MGQGGCDRSSTSVRVPTALSERPIILLGLRGSGKTTVGRLLAKRLDRAFVDLDDRTLDLLRSRHGVASIAEVFSEFGEPVFRDAETEALARELDRAAEEPTVLSLGGGTPTAPGAPGLLRDSGGVLVYLRFSPQTLRGRLHGEIDGRRPALTDQNDPLAEIAAVYDDRDPVYHRIATVVIEDEGAPEDVVRAIMDRLDALASEGD